MEVPNDYVVIQISISNLDGKPMIKKQLLEINAALNECCSKLEKCGYVSAGLYFGGCMLNYYDILAMEEDPE